jgi:hypothetical protein
VNPKKNREITYESTLERDLAYILLAHPDVDDVRDQDAIGYVDDKQRKHTFDLVAHLKSGQKTAFAVKPSKRVASSGITETIDLIRAQAPKGFADDFAVRTGEHITRVRADNARLQSDKRSGWRRTHSRSNISEQPTQHAPGAFATRMFSWSRRIGT